MHTLPSMKKLYELTRPKTHRVKRTTPIKEKLEVLAIFVLSFSFLFTCQISEKRFSIDNYMISKLNFKIKAYDVRFSVYIVHFLAIYA
jgi:hypothetical protein